MSIQLEHGEDFNNGLKRLILEECTTAREAIAAAETMELKHEAAHSARKAFKKVRACLRLVRDQVDFYKDENVFFRDLGRKMSEVRDATSNLETLDLLEKQFENELYKNAFDGCRKILEAHREELAAQVFERNQQLEKIDAALQDKMQEVNGWKIEVENFGDLKPSLKRVYKRGLKGYQKSLETNEVEDLHQWRKRVKYLRYQLDILNPIWPVQMEAFEDELHNLSDYTGFLHDLDVMLATLKKYDAQKKYPEQFMLLQTLAEKQMSHMRQHSLLLGQRFYFPGPGQFCKLIENYWEAYHTELERSELPELAGLEY